MPPDLLFGRLATVVKVFLGRMAWPAIVSAAFLLVDIAIAVAAGQHV